MDDDDNNDDGDDDDDDDDNDDDDDDDDDDNDDDDDDDDENSNFNERTTRTLFAFTQNNVRDSLMKQFCTVNRQNLRVQATIIGDQVSPAWQNTVVVVEFNVQP